MQWKNFIIYDISLPNTRERELRALEKGMKHFGLKKGIILTVSHEESVKAKDFRIDIIPVPRWFLSEFPI